MRKILSRVTKSIFIVVFATGAVIAATDNQALTETMKKKFPGSSITSAHPVEGIPGLVELVAGKKIIYSSLDGQQIVVGHIFNTKTNRDVTQDRLNQLLKASWNSLDLGNAITIKKGNGSREFAVYSDITCGYCQKLEKEMQSLTDYTMHIILVSREYLGTKNISSMAMKNNENIICSSDSGKAFTDFMLKGTSVSSNSAQCDAKKIIEGQSLNFAKNGLMGTPNLIARNGQVNAGYMPAAKLEAWLNANAK